MDNKNCFIANSSMKIIMELKQFEKCLLFGVRFFHCLLFPMIDSYCSVSLFKVFTKISKHLQNYYVVKKIKVMFILI